MVDVERDVIPGFDLAGAVSFARRVLAEAREENVPFMAGSIAYQAFVSLVPLLVLVFFAVSLVGGEELAARVVAFSESFLPTAAAELLGDSITGTTGTAGASLVGLVTLVWGTLKVFRGLDTAFSEIYDTTRDLSFVDRIVDGVVVLAVMAGAVLATSAGVTAISLLSLPAEGTVLTLVQVGVYCVAFYPMYARFPNVPLTRRQILPGVVVAALGWATLQAVFGLYVELAGSSTRAGVFGAVILLLTWLYLGGFVVLVGAVTNAVIAGRRRGPPDWRDTGRQSGNGFDPESQPPAATGANRLGRPAGLRVGIEPTVERANRDVERANRDADPEARLPLGNSNA